MEKLIDKYDIELAEAACHVGAAYYGALVNLPDDISAVFPYLNALVEKARYDHDNEVLILEREGQKYAFRPCEIRVAEVRDLSHAREVAREIVEWVNGIWQDRDSITPSYRERKQPPVMEVFKLLPRTNCGQCGYTTCMAFAAAVSRGTAKPEDCPPLCQDMPRERERLLELVSSA
jgi:ArsR family metal-binding transcriptional regulator